MAYAAKEKGRVLFVLNSATGGATLSATDAMGRLGARGWRCFAVVPPGQQAEGPALARVTEDLREVALPWWNRNYRARLWKRPVLFGLDMVRSRMHAGSVAKLVALIRRWDIDIVHTNTSLNLDGAVAARLTGRRHVWHIREQIGARALMRFWLPEPALARTFVALSDALIANSHETSRFFARNGVGGRVRVIENGVDVTLFDAAERGAELRQAWGVPNGAPLFGMVANLTSRMKRHDVFLRAAARLAESLPDARFVVVGVDPDVEGGYRGELEYCRSVKRLAAELGLEGRVVWAGFLRDVPAVTNAIDVLVHPSDRESFGRVVVEAMAARRPAVGAASGGVGEIIVDGETGFRAPPGDPEAFAEAMRRLAMNATLRRDMGDAGYRRAVDRYSLDRTVDALEDVYEGSDA